MSTRVGAAHIDVTASTTKALAAVRALRTQAERDLAALSGVNVGLKLKGPTKAEVSAALSNLPSQKTIKVTVDSGDAATRLAQLRTLLQNLGASVGNLFAINTSGLGAILSATTSMNTQFQGTVNELRRVLEEIRRTRPPTGPPAGAGGAGRGGAGGVGNEYATQLRTLQADLRSGAVTTAEFEAATRRLKSTIDAEVASLRSLGVLTAEQQRRYDSLRITAGQAGQALGRVGPSANAGVQQLARELQVAQSQYERGALSLRGYLREMERIRTAGQGMAAGLQAGSREAQALERVMAGLGGATRNINAQSITQLRSGIAAARAEFERATAAANGFAARRAAVQAYNDTLRQIEQQIAKVGQRTTITTAQMGELNRLTAQVRSGLNTVNNAPSGAGFAGGIMAALRQLPQFAMQAGGSLGAAAMQANMFGQALQGIGLNLGPMTALITGAVAALAAFGVAASASLNEFTRFQDNIQNAKATLGLFGEAGRAAGKELQALAQSESISKLGFDSNSAAKAIEELGSRGLDTSEILNGGLNTAAKLAAAAGVKDLTVSSEILVGTMKAFGIQGEEAAKIPDLLANAANVSALKLDDFRLAIAAGGSAARTAGVSVVDFTAIMSLMRDRLISASDAGTSFKAFTQALTPNTKDAAAAMRELGFNAFDSQGKMKPFGAIIANLAEGLKGYTDQQKLATLETIFGSDGVRTAMIALDAYNTTNAEGVRLLDERTGALTRQGTADLAAKERTDSLAAAQAELSNKIQILKQRMGEQLLPAAQSVVSAMTDLVDWFGQAGKSSDHLKTSAELLGLALLVIKRNAIAAWATTTWAGLAGAATGVAGLTAAVGRLTLAMGGIPGILAALTAAFGIWASSVINDIQRVQDEVAASEQQSQDSLMAQVKKLREAGDAYSLAKARYLLSFATLQDAQRGVPQVGFFGEITYKPDPAAVAQAQKNFDAAKLALEAARVGEGNGQAGSAVITGSAKDITAAFLSAIQKQESGGNYRAFNTRYDPRTGAGQGAVGKYQVMPFNFVDPFSYSLKGAQRAQWARDNMDTRGAKGFGWDFLATGKDFTIRELLADPEAQEKIAQYMLGKYLKEELTRSKGDVQAAVKAAAKRWYGSGTLGGTTPEKYQTQVWQNFLGATGGVQPLTGQGPLLPGQDRAGQSGSSFGLAAVQAAMQKTGVQTADMVVNYCAQWVRLTLGKADKRVEPLVNKLFQADRNKDGQTDARDAALGAKEAGLLRQYSGLQDLKPGDTVFYTEGGQNHAGLYIGNGMVRGNNRVTYQQNGGRFGPGGIASGAALDAGKVNPVGNVSISALGRVTGYMSAADLAVRAGAGSAPVAGTAARAQVSAEALKKEALRILTAIQKYEKEGKLDEKIAAEGVLNRFIKSGPRAAAAVDLMRSQLGSLRRETSQFGKAFDDLKAKMTLADSGDRLGENVIPQLKGIQTAALNAAAAERKLHGETAKYIALRDLAADAAQKIKTIEGRKPEQTAAQREQATLREAAAQQALEKAIRGASNARLAAIVKGGVKKEGDLARVQAAQKEIDRREELGDKRRREAQQRAAAVNDAIRQNDIAKANLHLKELERLRDRGLDKVKGNAQAELAVQKQYADLIYNARKAVLGKEKADRDASIRNDKTLTPQLRTAQLATSERTYAQALAEADDTRVQALSASSEKLTGVIRDLRGEYSKLAGSIREQVAAGTFDEDARQTALKTFNDITRRAKEAGLSTNTYVAGARKATWALAQQGAVTQSAADQAAAFTGSLEAQAKAVDEVAASTLALFTQDGEAAEQAQNRADAIGQLRSALEAMSGVKVDPATLSGLDSYGAFVDLLLKRGVKLEGLNLDKLQELFDLLRGLTLRAADYPNIEPKDIEPITDSVQELSERLDTQAKRLDDVRDAYQRGETDAEGYGQQLTALAGSYDQQATAMDRLGNSGAAEFFRSAAALARQLATEVGYVTDSVRELQVLAEGDANRIALLEGIASVFDGSAGDVATRVQETFTSGVFGELNPEAQRSFMDRLRAWLLTADLKSIGRDTLRALLTGMQGADSTDAKVFTDALGKVIQGTDSADLQTELSDILFRADQLQRSFTAWDDPVALMAYRDALEELNGELRTLRLGASGTDLEDVDSALGVVTSGAQEATSALALLLETLSSDPSETTAALNAVAQGVTDTINKAHAEYQSGVRDGESYNQVLDEQAALLGPLLARLRALGPAYATAADGVQLLLDTTRDLRVEGDPVVGVDASVTALDEKAAGAVVPLVNLVEQFRAGAITSAEFADEVYNALPGLEDLAVRAERMGNTKLAAELRVMAQEMEGLAGSALTARRAMEGLRVGAQVMGKNSPLQAGISSAMEGLAAFFGAGGREGGSKAILTGAASFVGGLVDVFKTGDEDIDKVASTFVSGLQGTLMQLAQGNWIGALVAGVATVVSTIVDIFTGGANSAKKARDQIGQATQGIKFFDTSKYAKVVSQGGFWGWLGFKKSEIDQEAVDIARSLGDALYEAISGGMLDGIKAGKSSFSELNLDLKKSLAQNILQGLIDGFLQGEVMKNVIQPFLDRFIAAKRTVNDPTDDVAAAQDLQKAVVEANTLMAGFYNEVLVPASEALGVFGSDKPTDTTLGGSAARDLGLASAPAAVMAADARTLDLIGAVSKITPVLERLTPMLDRLTADGISVAAHSEVTVHTENDMRAYATQT